MKTIADYPLLVKQWHPTKNGAILPQDISHGSRKCFWWICEKSHEWQTSCKERSRGRGCSYCAGKRVCSENCLATRYPELAVEWHPTKNNLTPRDILPQSNKKYWWSCKKGHEWCATSKDRVQGQGCPTCNESRGEKRIAQYLQLNNYSFTRQAKFANCKHIKCLPFDFSVNNTLIEYQGKQHYFPLGFGASKEKTYKEFSDIVKRDHKKEQWCNTNSVKLLVIPYWHYDDIETILNDFFLGNKVAISEPPKIVKKYQALRERIINE